MNEWLLLIFFALVGSVFSLVGGVYLLYSKKGGRMLQKISAPFAAGALLAVSFFDLLPESLHESGGEVLVWTLCGFLIFFVMERFLHWFHHHHEHEDAKTKANRSLIIIGDTLHNFLDGIAIAAAFLVNPATGIVTAVVVALHEIPQEIGDFGLLLSKGMKREKVLLYNLLSALATLVGAVIVYAAGQTTVLPTGIMLAITAGFFVYIAASDIIPTIHQKADTKLANAETMILLLAVALVGITTSMLHGFIG
ncbi:MAG: ZIP family metal transporter [Candidatus Woesebacteria bacterium]|jgi:zinc and cadmium transporter